MKDPEGNLLVIAKIFTLNTKNEFKNYQQNGLAYFDFIEMIHFPSHYEL